MYVFKISERIATISTGDKVTKDLTLTSWNNAPEKLDIRTWRDTPEGLQPGKGITLTDSEALALHAALSVYLGTTDPTND